MQKNKLKVIRNLSTFKNVNDIQFFLKLNNFYRRFIKNFNRIIFSLIEILKNLFETFKKNKKRKRRNKIINSINVLKFFD